MTLPKPYFETDLGKLYCGHVLNILDAMPDESVQCCITSPPYWGLRDYGIEPQIWGDPGSCKHRWSTQKLEVRIGTGGNWQQANNGPGLKKGKNQTRFKGDCRKANECETQIVETGFCQNCGAWRGSLGLEPTPELYVKHIVEIFRQVKRVLRDDGTLWLNLGDSYARSPSRGVKFQSGPSTYLNNRQANELNRGPEVPLGLKEKDLIGIPWRVALALQADGWYLRSDIIWSKPNPMPESVTDRPTKAHEYIFLMSKNQRYYYNADEIRESHLPESIKRDKAGYKAAFKGRHTMPGENRPNSTDHNGFNNPNGRNKRSVWTCATAPFPEAHFATFPPKLIEPCIFAGSRENDIVLDQFSGAGTTPWMCERYKRKWAAIDLSEEYCEIAKRRIVKERQQLKLW